MATPSAASPIQVVLDARRFVTDWSRPLGGGNTDFFAGNDANFVAHRNSVVGQLHTSREQLLRTDDLGVGFLKVSMRTEALAKSHRPVKALFRADRARVVGMAGPGQLILAVTPEALDAVADTAVGAEDGTRYKSIPSKNPKKPPKIKPNPSRPRAEVGAIEQLALWDATDRRSFSVEQALDWLQDPRTGGFYLVELFVAPPPPGQWDRLDAAQRRLFESFRAEVQRLGRGVRVERIAMSHPQQALFAVWVLQQDTPPQLFLDARRASERQGPNAPVDLTPARHRSVLSLLEQHPLIKRIHLPPIVTPQPAMAGGSASQRTWAKPTRDATRTYPRVAVVDGGIGPCLDDWVVDRWPYVADADHALDHATFIGGLLVAGGSINAAGITSEADGCELVDVKLLPREDDPAAFPRYYGTHGALGFFQELEDAVAILRQRSQVRVFNLSANFQTMADPTRYNPLTAQLDAIADVHDVVFVLSAGNADGAAGRAEWPADPTQAMAILADATQDRVRSPAESIRGISVGALNPPHLDHVIPHAPASYSRRGPGLMAGLKPDVAHVGGAGTSRDGDTGLWSVHTDGTLYSAAGTSYAAPLVAKTLAALAHGIEGEVSRETLTALLLHHAALPEALSNPAFGRAARHLVGFGLPPGSDEILQGADHQITMVFAARLMRGRRLEFPFVWPACLTTPEGKCRGFAQMTLVATPPTDPRAESELVRVDLQAHLNQLCSNGAHASCGWLATQPGKSHHREVRLIAEEMKWSPVKIYQWRSPDGQGSSTNWRLAVDHLSRDNESMPAEGVPFTVLLTLGDPDKQAPVFQQMRQLLQANGVRLEQIQTAARISARI